jgi:hypothetical protein
MCFGPGPSFAASAVLAAAGTATLKESRSSHERLFALFPLIFAAHQFIEGLLWLVLEHPALHLLEQALTFIYLLIAYCLWPFIAPLGLCLLEPDAERKRAVRLIALLGGGMSLYLLYFIVTGPIQASVVNCSLQYRTLVPRIAWHGYTYTWVVLFPYFLSSYRPVRVIGLINLVFYGVAYYFYSTTFSSVWCFFAATLSLNIYFFFRWLHHRKIVPIRLPA